ncbi:TPA: LysR family transcriptional regulator [Kluyvera georgiana]
MDLNAVEMFVYVVRAGSLSKAAQQSGIPLPTLSRRVRALEDSLNLQLIERSVRGVKLTVAGMHFYQQASAGVDILKGAQLASQHDERQISGYLRLSIPPAMTVWWELLAQFQQRYPGIRLFVQTTERRVDLVADGIDVALRVGAIEHETMVAKRVISWRHQLVAAPSLVERYGRPQSPADLSRYPCAVWNASAWRPSIWSLGGETVHPAAILMTNDYAHLYQRVLSGDVISELPPFMVNEDIAQGRLVGLLEDYPLPEQHIHLVYPPQHYPAPAIRAYLDFCSRFTANLS